MRSTKSLVCIAVFIFVTLWPLSPVLARQVTVDDDGPADYRSVEEAIKAATEGDTILVKAGRYQETYLPLKNRMVLQGAGADVTVIEWYRSRSLPVLVEIDRVQGVKVDGFTFKGPGKGEYGGILIIDCAPVISNNKIIDGFAAIRIALYAAWFVESSEQPFIPSQEGFPSINGNTITGNDFGIYFDIAWQLRKYDPDFFAMLDLRSNWWEKTDRADIVQITKPLLSTFTTVLYEPWLTALVGTFETRPGIHYNNIYGNRQNLFSESGAITVEGITWGKIKETIKGRE